MFKFILKVIVGFKLVEWFQNWRNKRNCKKVIGNNKYSEKTRKAFKSVLISIIVFVLAYAIPTLIAIGATIAFCVSMIKLIYFCTMSIKEKI